MECPCAVLAYCALLDVLCRVFSVAGFAAAHAAQSRKNRLEGRHAARRCLCHQAAVLARRCRPVAPAGWPHGRGGRQRQEHRHGHGGAVATAARGGRTGGRVRVRIMHPSVYLSGSLTPLPPFGRFSRAGAKAPAAGDKAAAVAGSGRGASSSSPAAPASPRPPVVGARYTPPLPPPPDGTSSLPPASLLPL
jgi:hypothetical protein